MHFFERTYKLLRDFCDSEDDIVSVNIVCEFIQQLVDNNSKAKPIACPDDFISDEKVDIWKTLKRKLSSCRTLDDSVSKNIDVLWVQWSRLLFEKESKEEEGENESYITFCLSPLLVNTPHSERSVHSVNSQHSIASPYSLISVHSVPSCSQQSVVSQHSVCSPRSVTSPQSVSTTYSVTSPQSVASPSSLNSLHSVTSPSSEAGPESFSLNAQPGTPIPSTSTSLCQGGHCSTGFKHINQNPESDGIIEQIAIRVLTEENQDYGFFHYAKKSNDKFMCKTDGCKMTTNKETKIRNEGVTRETLIGHAMKCHSIRLNLKKKVGILQPGFNCPYCPKSFTRPQNLVKHQEKCHPLPQIEFLDEFLEPPGYVPTMTYMASLQQEELTTVEEIIPAELPFLLNFDVESDFLDQDLTSYVASWDQIG